MIRYNTMEKNRILYYTMQYYTIHYDVYSSLLSQIYLSLSTYVTHLCLIRIPCQFPYYFLSNCQPFFLNLSSHLKKFQYFLLILYFYCLVFMSFSQSFSPPLSARTLFISSLSLSLSLSLFISLFLTVSLPYLHYYFHLFSLTYFYLFLFFCRLMFASTQADVLSLIRESLDNWRTRQYDWYQQRSNNILM